MQRHSTGSIRHALVPLWVAVLVSLGGCPLTGIGAEGRAHREEAALHKLLDGQSSYAALVQTMHERWGDRCADQATHVLADRRTLQKFDPPKPGRVLTCTKKMDWNLPPFACSWQVDVYADAVENDAVDYRDISSTRICF
jgi:hypothetical protein